MTRTDIINHLIKSRGYKTYLEIGMDNPAYNFLHIICENKESCDPYLNDNYDARYNRNNLPDIVKNNLTYHMTSDEMFKTIPIDKKWDIIFIDGLHVENQVSKDIANAVMHLNEGGCVVLHDSIPRSYAAQVEERMQDEWNGTVWKAVAKLNCTNLKFNTVGIIDGMTIIEYNPHPRMSFLSYKCDLEYKEDFNDELMHIIPEDEFLKRY